MVPASSRQPAFFTNHDSVKPCWQTPSAASDASSCGRFGKSPALQTMAACCLTAKYLGPPSCSSVIHTSRDADSCDEYAVVLLKPFVVATCGSITHWASHSRLWSSVANAVGSDSGGGERPERTLLAKLLSSPP